MSEYQYYEFQTIDRSLTEKEMTALARRLFFGARSHVLRGQGAIHAAC